jgi:hypothetical protein
MSRDATADAARRAKIAAAKKGKPRPAHVGEVLAASHTGRPLSEEHRRKLSAAYRRRGTRPPKAGRPWTAAEARATAWARTGWGLRAARKRVIASEAMTLFGSSVTSRLLPS